MPLKNPADRNPWFDNAKLLLITLVVTGHFLEVFYVGNIYAQQAWRLIYVFHMPAFVFLAGFYTRPHRLTKTYGSVKKLLVPFIVFSIIYEFCHVAFTGEISNYTAHLSPYWLLWFLLCLVIWTLSLPHVLALRYPFATLVALSLAAGLVDSVGYPLSLSRVLVFFPFFLLGYRFAEKKLLETTPFHNPVYILPAVLTMAAVLPLIDVLQINRLMLLGTVSYNVAELSWQQGLVMRTEVLVISVLALLSFLFLIPRNENRFTSLGRNSIVVYLLHGFFVRAFEYLCHGTFKQIAGLGAVALSIVAGLIVTLILSAKPVRSAYDRCLSALASRMLEKRGRFPLVL